MQLDFESRDSMLIVRVSGELDLKTAEIFKDTVDERMQQSKSRDLLLDLGQLEFIDSSGLGAILGRYRKLKKKGGRLAVCGLNPTVQRIFELSGMFKILTAFNTKKQALDNLKQGG